MSKHSETDRRATLNIAKALMMALLSTLTGCLTVRETSRSLSPAQPSPSSSPTSSPEIEMSVRQLIAQLPFIEKEKRAGMLRAWDHVPNYNNFRVANKSDFDNPFFTYDYGEIAGAHGLAVLIVNKDGTRGVCEIQWSKKQRKWTCQSL